MDDELQRIARDEERKKYVLGSNLTAKELQAKRRKRKKEIRGRYLYALLSD
jgi:hypothetical protein